MTDLVEVRRGAHHDSVSLMRVSKAVRRAPGVHVALVAPIGTESTGWPGFVVHEMVETNRPAHKRSRSLRAA